MPETQVHLRFGDLDVLRADAERAMGLHTPAGEPILWRGGCGFGIGPDQRLRFEPAPLQWLPRLLLRSAYAAGVLVTSHITAVATQRAWIAIVGNVAAILLFGVSWFVERASIRRSGRTRRVEMYALTPTGLVFVASDAGGTQTWTLRKPDLTGITPGWDGTSGSWVSGMWRNPDGFLAHASMALRGVDQAIAGRIGQTLRP